MIFAGKFRMLFKKLLPKCFVFLRSQRKYSEPLWRLTLMRCAGSDAVREELVTCALLDMYRHSPINVITKLAVFRKYDQMTLSSFDKPDIPMIMSNTGYTVKISFPESELEVSQGGLVDTYRVHHIHFHWAMDSKDGSEHYLDNDNFPMEMHIVTYNTKFKSLTDAQGKQVGISVLAFLFEISKENNPALSPIIEKLPLIKQPDSLVPLKLPSLLSILPADVLHIYQYTDVNISRYPYFIWTVFKNTITISEVQIEAFRNLLSDRKDPVGDYPVFLGGNYRLPEEFSSLAVFRNFRDPIQTRKAETRKKNHAFARFIYGLLCGGKKKKRHHVSP